MAKRKKFWTIWKLIIALSFCLNVFGGYKLIGQRWSQTSWVKRESVKLAWDGLKYRYGGR